MISLNPEHRGTIVLSQEGQIPLADTDTAGGLHACFPCCGASVLASLRALRSVKSH